MVRGMKKSRLNPGPHKCPKCLWEVDPEVDFSAPFMKVPAHLQGYVVEYIKLHKRKLEDQSDLLQQIFWATMKALPEWREKAPKDASCYELRAKWEVVAGFVYDDQ